MLTSVTSEVLKCKYVLMHHQQCLCSYGSNFSCKLTEGNYGIINSSFGQFTVLIWALYPGQHSFRGAKIKTSLAYLDVLSMKNGHPDTNVHSLYTVRKYKCTRKCLKMPAYLQFQIQCHIQRLFYIFVLLVVWLHFISSKSKMSRLAKSEIDYFTMQEYFKVQGRKYIFFIFII